MAVSRAGPGPTRHLRALALLVALTAASSASPWPAWAGEAVAAGEGSADPSTRTGSPAASVVDLAFEPPSARGDLSEDVIVEATFQAAQPPRRVELVRRLAGDEVARVSLAAVEPVSAGTWRARVVQAGHVAPNTAYRYQFRAVTADGRTIAGPEAVHRITDPRFAWRSLSDDHVTVWWYEGDDAFARRALDVAEAAIVAASELLGAGDIDPVDFYVYADDRSFRQAMGPATRENVGGEAHPDIRTLFGIIEPRQIGSDWVPELVAHELAHLVFDEVARGPYDYPPRWLNEGVAVLLSRGLDEGDRAQVAGAARSGSIIPLEGLAGQFPTRASRFRLAYAESVSAVDHLVRRHGEAAVRELVATLAGGGTLDEAFVAATGDDFLAFEDDWLGSVGAQRPDPYGPTPGATATLPGTTAPIAAALLR
jgi:hypothetical protein